MPRFEPKYPVEAREAVVEAALDNHWSGPKAVQELAQGHIPGYPKPLDVPIATMYEWLRQGRRARQEQAIPNPSDQTPATTMRTIFDRLAKDWERRWIAANTRKSPDELIAFAEAARKLGQVAQQLEKPPAKPPAQTPQSPSEPTDFRTRLEARQHKATQTPDEAA